MTIENVSGWNDLMNGKVISASFNLYSTLLNGWTIAILFVVFQILVYIKTKNIVMMWISGIFFASMYAVSMFSRNSIVFIFAILILELAGIMYYMFFK
jgi:hypothetical protein